MQNSTDNRVSPLVAISLGDPGGIGAEIIAAAWPHLVAAGGARYVVFGRQEYLRRAIQLVSTDLELVELNDIADVPSPDPRRIVFQSVGDHRLDGVPPGALDARGGQLAFECVTQACQCALGGNVDALVTAPLNKAALHLAGHDFPGHTELLAHLCGVQKFAMMLYVPPQASGKTTVGGDIGLGVVHTTLHQSLRSAIDGLSTERIWQMCQLAHDFGIASLTELDLHRRPRIAVAALNPHAGEQGLFGREEIEIIEPAIRRAQAAGMECSGPWPCDTLMARAAAGEFDLIVAMYHDQGHIALKLLGMHRSVNVTLGLPIVRTSVAHGTAYELAGTGQADPGSLIRAAVLAGRLARDRATAAARSASGPTT